MMLGGISSIKTTVSTPAKCRLAGRVTVNSIGASKRILILERGSMKYVASTHSNTDGSWEIRGMPVFPERSLVAIAFDDTGVYNAEILDFLSQVE